jgi:hypothetical protein
MTSLLEAYQAKDRNRLEIGWAALEEIEQRIQNDKEAGITSPRRTALSEILEELSVEFSSYHASQTACRSYIRDSVRLGRFFVPERVEELKPYKLTTGHLLACTVAGEWPDCNEEETRRLLDWTIENKASPSEIWDHRREEEKKLSEEEKTARKVIKAAEKYLEITSSENGFSERRKVCSELINTFTLINMEEEM